MNSPNEMMPNVYIISLLARIMHDDNNFATTVA
jgi:hypothetical protein